MSSGRGRVDDIQIVHNLKNTAAMLQADIQAYAESLRNRASYLGDSWKDSQYDRFMDCIDSLTSQLISDAAVINDALSALEYELRE